MLHLQTTVHTHSASEFSEPPDKTEPLPSYMLITGNCSVMFSTSRLFTIKRFWTTLKAALVSLLSHNFTYPTCFPYRRWKIRNKCIVGKAPNGKIKLHRLCNNRTDGFKYGRQWHCTCIPRAILKVILFNKNREKHAERNVLTFPAFPHNQNY